MFGKKNEQSGKSKRLPSILVCVDAGTAGQALLPRRDVSIHWALNRPEVDAVLAQTRVQVCLTRESLALEVLEAVSAQPVPVIVLVEADGWTRKDTYQEKGATALVAATNRDLILEAISALTGLPFAQEYRVPYSAVVDVSISEEVSFLQTADISVSGISIYDFPPSKVGTVAMIELTSTDPPLSLSAVTVRYFRYRGRSAAGLRFHELTEAERKVLEDLVASQSKEEAAAPEPMVLVSEVPSSTADLPAIQEVPDRETLAAVIHGKKTEPEWLFEIVQSLTPVEIAAAEGEEAPDWAHIALDGRLRLAAGKARALGRNLTTSEFSMTFDLCRDLGAAARGAQPALLTQLTEIRTALLRELYGTEPSSTSADILIESIPVDTAVDTAVEAAVKAFPKSAESPVEVPIESIDIPIEDEPIEDVPIEDVAIEDVPIEDVPIEDVPIEDVPIEDVVFEAPETPPAPARPVAPEPEDVDVLLSSTLDDVSLGDLIGSVPRSGESPSVDETRSKAQLLIAAGLIKEAAELFKNAGLLDEAIHLYLKVLSSPTDAAPLVAERFGDTQAAELYQLGGDNENAAKSLARAAMAAPRPEALFGRIKRLSPAIGLELLEALAKERSLSATTVEIHYQLGLALKESDQQGRAQAIFDQIRQTVGEYKTISIESVPEVQDGHLSRRRTEPPGGTEAPLMPPADEPSQNQPAGTQETFLGLMEDAFNDVFAENELQDLAQEVAQEALQDLHLGLEDGMVLAAQGVDPEPAEPESSAPAPASAPEHPGLEGQPLPRPLADARVRNTRSGPSAHALKATIDKRPCDESSVASYYQLGLVRLQQGLWDDALQLFEVIQQSVPGYEDAALRAAAIHGWRIALEPNLTRLALAGRSDQPRCRYLLRGELGRSGRAVVFLAKDVVTGENVALKLYADVPGQDRRAIFTRLRQIARLEHGNVASMVDLGELEGRIFVATEHVAYTVGDLLCTRDHLPVVESLRMISQVADALDHAHRSNLVHGRISATNVMRTAMGVVKLTDFSPDLAQFDRESKDASLAYQPPEVLDGAPRSSATDLFAIGALLYELITGEQAFNGADRSPPKPFSAFAKPRPEWLGQIVFRAIHQDPSARFQSAAELGGVLHKVMESLPITRV